MKDASPLPTIAATGTPNHQFQLQATESILRQGNSKPQAAELAAKGISKAGIPIHAKTHPATS